MSAAADRLEAAYADDLAPEVIQLVHRFAELANRYDRKGFGGPRTISHGDFRDDNLMFGPDRVCVVDWQTVQLGSGVADVAYYLAGSLRTEDRRAHEQDLVRAYHEQLGKQGVELPWDNCWREYRRHGLCLLTTALKTVGRRHELPARARTMLIGMLGRSAAQAIDLESLELLV
jgi:aminoglycoside phosphotransferase (APT) family kinase protein